MNFEKNRKEMLAQLSKIKRDSAIKRKRASAQQRAKENLSNPGVETIVKNKIHTKIIMYGNNSFFLRSLIHGLQNTLDIVSFDNEENACDYCINNAIAYVFIDMDKPTDWKKSTDLFTTVKTINASIELFLMTGDPDSVPVRTLAERGGIVLTKPIDRDSILSYIS